MRPIIIGSGMGGLSIALIMKKNGMDPIIFEKDNRYGGSFTSYKVGKYQVDTGLHLLTRGSTGELPVLMKKYIGKDVFQKHFVKQKEYRFYLGDKNDKLPSNLPELLKFRMLGPSERIRFIRMLLHFLKIGRENTNTNLSTYEYVKKYVKSDDFLYFLNALSWMCNGCSIKEGSLSRFVDMFVRKRKLSLSYVIKHTSSKRNAAEEDWYPKGGLITVPRLFISEGLKVKTGKKVDSIIVKDNRVAGVKVGGKIYKSKLVVYTGLVRNLKEMISGGELNISEPKYGEYKAITLWLGFKKKIAEWNRTSKIKIMKNFEPPHWCMFISDFDSSLAPDGHQLLGVSSILHKKNQVKEMKKTVEFFLPGYEDYVEMEHVQVYRAEKTLQKNGNNIFTLPDQKTNIEGLYITGTDTRGWGSGGTLCADTAFRCWKYINDINF